MRGSEGARGMTPLLSDMLWHHCAASPLDHRQREGEGVTVERLERAIDTVAEMMVKHDMPLGPTIRYLESERDKRRQRTADMDYAKEILARKRAQQRKQHQRSETDLSH
jgi:hypothetical protein